MHFPFKDSNATKANFSSKDFFFVFFPILTKHVKLTLTETKVKKSMAIKSTQFHIKENSREMHLKVNLMRQKPTKYDSRMFYLVMI